MFARSSSNAAIAPDSPSKKEERGNGEITSRLTVSYYGAIRSTLAVPNWLKSGSTSPYPMSMT
jgi:hypothetical protein